MVAIVGGTYCHLLVAAGLTQLFLDECDPAAAGSADTELGVLMEPVRARSPLPGLDGSRRWAAILRCTFIAAVMVALAISTWREIMRFEINRAYQLHAWSVHDLVFLV
jgi:hypothetical protein